MRNILLLFFLFTVVRISGQNNIVRIYSAPNHQKPLIVYLSGDGGFNSFSDALCKDLAKNDYEVLAINSNAYFKKKKTPLEASTFLESQIRKYVTDRINPNIILLGYSFGADVIPFIYTIGSATITKTTSKIMLLAPSPTTDFEIHLLDMLDMNGTYKMDVAAEINKITTLPIYVVAGSKTEFPSAKIKNKNTRVTIVNGNTHFNKNPDAILPIIYQTLK